MTKPSTPPTDHTVQHPPWVPPTLHQVPISRTAAELGVSSDGEVANGS